MKPLSPSVCPLFILLSTGVLAVGCGGAGATCDNTAIDGYRTVTHDGENREYILHVPSGYDSSSSESMPLVVVFHGNGQCAADFASEDFGGNMNGIGDTQNVLVAYPQGAVRGKGNTEWDPATTDSGSIVDNDLSFVDHLIEDISSEYSVDASRIYAAGYSNGGMMAYGLACHRGDVFGAVGIMSGIMLTDTTCATDQVTSVIHFHGTSDFALPYDGSGAYPSVADTVSFWLNHNGISAESLVSTSLDDGQVTHDVYTGGTADSSVVLYTIEGGDHIWFEQDIGGQNPNEILWSFLSSY